MPQLDCTACGYRVSVRDELAGRKVRCPKCGVGIAVPAVVDEFVAVEPESMKGGQPSVAEGVAWWSRYVLFYKLMEALDSGVVVIRVASVVWQTAVALASIVFLLVWFAACIAASEMRFVSGAVFIAFQFASLVAFLLSANLHFLRGRRVATMQAQRFVAIPIVAGLVSATGESILLYGALMTGPVVLLAWVAGLSALPYIPFRELGDGMIATILTGCLAGAAYLFVSVAIYLATRVASEFMIVLFSISADLNRLRSMAESPDSHVRRFRESPQAN